MKAGRVAWVLACGFNLGCSNAAFDTKARSPGAQPGPAFEAEHASTKPSAPADTTTVNPARSTEPGLTETSGRSDKLLLPVDAGVLTRALPPSSVSDYRTWAQTKRISVGLGYLYTIEPVNLNQWLLVQSDEQPTVFIYDNHTYKPVGKWPVPSLGPNDHRTLLAWPDRPGREPCFLSAGAEGMTLYNAVSGRVMKQLNDAAVTQARWSEDGNILVTVTSRIDTQTSDMTFYRRSADLELTRVATLPTTERVDAWDLSRDNRYIARGFYPSGSVTIVDLHTGEEWLQVNAPGHASSIEYSPDERFLAVGGEGVLVVDLAQPTRRAEYSYFYNNVSEVEFSPSGDVLAVASFDGRVRLLKYVPELNRMVLVHTLHHDRQANVYGLRFIDNGATLVSSSGDRSLRYWGNRVTAPLDAQTVPQWQSIGERTRAVEAPALPIRAATDEPQTTEHYVPARLAATPSPSRITPGPYACKISELYKLRECVVERDAQGHTLLSFSKDNLLGIRGVLFDDGPVVRFEGWLTDGGSLGCTRCAHQPIHGVLRGHGDSWTGLLLYRKHYDPLVPHEPPHANVTIEEAIDRYPVVLKRR